MRIADFIARRLKGDGFTVTHAPDGETTLKFLNDKSFDVVILDFMLSDMSGQDICRQMRAKNNLTPVLMLSALDKTDDRVQGLNVGADDYLPKPFHFDELTARLRALGRRNSWNIANVGKSWHTLECGRIRFNQESFIVTVDDQPVDLSDKEREMLLMFMLNSQKVLTREHILNSVWGIDCDPLTNVIDVYVGHLRKKLTLTKDELKNIRGIGYRFSVENNSDLPKI